MAILQNKFVREDGSIIGSSVIISCKYTSDVNSQTNLAVGDVTADEVEVEVRTPAVSITAGEKLTYYQIEDGTENLVGIFYAEAPTVATKTSIRFKAYDGKAKLAADFSEWLNGNQDIFPMTLRSLVGYACGVAGLSLAADSFQFENLSIPAFCAQGVTCRQIVSWTAQIVGCFVSCNTAGEILFDWYRKTDISISKTDFSQDGLSKKSYSTDLIKRVQFKQETNDVGVIYPADADGNVFSISQNGIAAVLDGATLRTIAQYLYEKLNYVTYTPLSAKLPKRTAKIRAGDIISVTDGNGNTVSTYVMKVYLDGSGTQISSTGDQNYADKAAVSSEQYRNIPGKVLLLEKSVDGLRIENKDTADKVAAIKLTVDGLETSVKDAEGNISKLEQSSEEITASVESVKKTSEEALKEAQKNATDLTNYANQVSGSLTDLQNQIDGAIETWFYDYRPTDSNFPASDWTTTEEKNKHLGDLFYIVDNKDEGGFVYRWALTNGVYGWVLVEDTEVAKALEAASRAADTADGKRRVFVVQPTPPYDVGDLWTDGHDLRVCKIAREDGEYVAGDFVLATDYTTEERVKTIIQQTPKGVEVTSSDGNGTLVTFIGNRDSGGAWEAEYTSDGEVKSSLKFDFSKGKFVFDGDIESSKMTASEIEGGRITGTEMEASTIKGGEIIGTTLGSNQGRVKSKMDETGLQLFYVDEDGKSVPVGIYGNLASASGGSRLPMLWLGDKSDPDRMGLLLKLYPNGIWLGTDQQRDSTGNFTTKDNQDAGIFIDNTTGLVEIIRGLYSANTFEAVFS